MNILLVLGACLGATKKADDTFWPSRTMSQVRVQEFMVLYANKADNQVESSSILQE
jgi:hypothetical protein